MVFCLFSLVLAMLNANDVETTRINLEPRFLNGRWTQVERHFWYVMGVRGDWKAFKQLMNLNRDQSKNEALWFSNNLLSPQNIKVLHGNLIDISCCWGFSTSLGLYNVYPSGLLDVPRHKGKRWVLGLCLYQYNVQMEGNSFSKSTI